MRSDLPLTVYFDASCGLCHSEMMNIKAHDSREYLRLVDCSAPDFDDAPFRADGITRADMMDRLHVRDNQGAWIKGVPAFELIYRTIGMHRMARLWGSRALMERLYPWIARHRHGLSLTGLPILFSLWGKCAARRAHKRSRACKDGKCSI
jgi:predicted DCC family thiol-disulfide oxidoreductase YuxK